MQPHNLSERACLRELTECELQSKSVGVWRAAPQLSTLSLLTGVTSCGNRHRVCKHNMRCLLSVDQNTWRVRSSPELERAGSDITLNSTLWPRTVVLS